jgi:hypothetical protein
MSKSRSLAALSTDKQSMANQLRELRQAPDRLGWQVTGEFIDRGLTPSRSNLRHVGAERSAREVLEVVGQSTVRTTGERPTGHHGYALP